MQTPTAAAAAWGTSRGVERSAGRQTGAVGRRQGLRKQHTGRPVTNACILPRSRLASEHAAAATAALGGAAHDGSQIITPPRRCSSPDALGCAPVALYLGPCFFVTLLTPQPAPHAEPELTDGVLRPSLVPVQHIEKAAAS